MNPVAKICRQVSEGTVLDQLQEECAELIQAAAKAKRVMSGDKHVDPRSARDNLIEELADVELLHTIVMHKLLDPEEQMAVCCTIAEKT